MKKLVLLLFLFQIASTACAHSPKMIVPVGCEGNPQLQSERSNELLKLAKEDQEDRSQAFDSIDWNKTNLRDMKRRQRVGEIFGEGCFQKASDYASAAIIYQHGTTADHYHQAFIWANEAARLGDKAQLSLAALAVDRYLVKIGHKELFGTQLSRSNNEKWCIQSVEPSFPDSMRMEYLGFNVKDQIARTLKSIGSSESATDIKDCEPPLKPSPKGTVPGFW